MNRIAGYIGGICGFIIAYAITRNYPGIFLQLIVAYALYWTGKKVIKKISAPNSSKNDSRKKLIYILSGLGLLGLLSPILGFIFALPAYLMASEVITHDYKDKKKVIYIAGAAIVICLLNAALGVIMNQTSTP